jgi:glycosyltransferase involved in cell wall biosynthesis
MKISFCLTTYNKLEFLQITLQNYFDNRKSNYELIVSDGCSTDGTVEYLEQLENDGLIDKLILSPVRDNGEWEGFKKTLDHVTGDYFYLLSDDDYFDFNCIDVIVGFLDKNRNVGYLIADGLDLKENKVEIGRYHSRMQFIDQELSKGANRNKSCDVLLSEGACGLGLFVNSKLISKLDLFSPKFGKRTDKGITSTLFNSLSVAASTDLRTYVGIKNEKSNSVLYGYDYTYMEQPHILADDPDKTFSVDIDQFKFKFSCSQQLLDQCPERPTGQFMIYAPFSRSRNTV